MELKKLKMLVTIVDRGKGEKVVHLYNQNGIFFNMILLGEGTADSEILDYLGIGETEKDVVLSIIGEEKVESTLKELKEKMKFSLPAKGIAFTVPLSSITGKILAEVNG